MEGVASIAIGVTLGSAVLALIIAPQIISDHQRYTTFLEAQRTVLQCRADHVTASDRICGPIPTIEQFQ